MRKIIAASIALAVLGGFILPALADDSTEINMTLSDSADINVETYDGSKYWNFSGSTSDTVTSTQFWLNNTGSVQVDVTINATDTDAWTINETADHNKFNISQNITESWVGITTAYQDFETDFAGSASTDFWFQVELPTSSSTATKQTTTITFVATVD